jgi:hypothetical protein
MTNLDVFLKLDKLNKTSGGRFVVSLLVGVVVTLFLDTYVNLVDELLIPLLFPKLKYTVLVKDENKIKIGKVLMSVIKSVLFIILYVYIV